MAVAVPDIHRDIIERSKTGDASAQYELYRLYSKAMFNIACRMMSRREEAEDILQDSFIDAFAHLQSFRYDSSFGSWLKRIVINHCLNEIKRRKTDLTFFDEMGHFDRAEGDEEIGIETALTVSNVRKAMEQLPNGSKVIFSLYLLEGYDHVEIAQILKITESNSKTQYMRAKQKVKEILKQQNNEAG